MQEEEIRKFIRERAQASETAAEKPQLGSSAEAGAPVVALEDMLRGSDIEFIENAYEVLLQRPAEEADIRIQREQLRDMKGNRIILLGQIRHSDEGNKVGITVEGLEKRYFVMRIKYKVRRVLGKIKKKLIKMIKNAKTNGPRLVECEKKLEEFGQNELECRRKAEQLEDDLFLLRRSLGVKNDAAPKTQKMHFELERALAGDSAEITARLQQALPYAKGAITGNENGEILALDLGCGTGEWLSILDEAGIPAVGVDNNSYMVEVCTDKQLHVQCADAVEYLETMSEGTFRVITAFDLAETLSSDELLRLFAAANRALGAGGVLLVRTLNPDAAGMAFYSNPSRTKPLPAAFLSLLAEKSGFVKTEQTDVQPDAAYLFAAYHA